MKKMIQSFAYALTVLLCLLLNMGTKAQKIVITKADDLPRRTIVLKGKATEILQDLPQLKALTKQLVKNLENDLVSYEIADKSTLKEYYSSLMACYFFLEDYSHAMSFIEKIQALTDKKAERITTGLFLSSFFKAKTQYPDEQSEDFKKAYTAEFERLWRNLPYEEVKEELLAMRGGLSIFNPALVTSGLETQIQPFLDNNKNIVPEGIVLSFVGIRLTLDKRAPLIEPMLQVLNTIYDQNKHNISKKDIWEERNIALSKNDKGTPVIVAIWDSGTDINVFSKEQLYTDKKGRHGVGYSLIDFTNDGLLLENTQGKIQSDIKKLQSLVKGMMDLQSAIESPQADQIKKTMANLKAEEAQAFYEELGFYGSYSHGTHVAGIALKDNPFAKLLVARMGFEYRSMPPAHSLSHAKFQAKMYTDVVKYFKENKVRIVNMSWRYGVSTYEGLLSMHGIGKNEEDRKKMAREMFEIEKKALYEAIKSAPDILFICAAGNENNDADFVEYIPASFEGLPNLLTIGAVDGEGKKTSFTSEGKNIQLYANGFEVESFVPGGDLIRFSGTSMASPEVANLAAKILALKPELTPIQVIQWIKKGADNLPENPDLKLIHPKKTLELLTGKTTTSIKHEHLLKKWKPDAATANLMADDYIAEIRQQNEHQADAMQAQKAMLAQMFEQITIEYKADGTSEVIIPQSPIQKGTWKISTENGKTKLETVIGEQIEVEFIEQINEKELKTTTAQGRNYTYVLAQ